VVGDATFPALVADLRAWQSLGEQLAGEDESTTTIPEGVSGSGVTMSVRFVSDREMQERKTAERRAADAARDARREWIDALEPLRDVCSEAQRPGTWSL
jgi:hypothetical protein